MQARINNSPRLTVLLIGMLLFNLFFGFAQIVHSQPQLTYIRITPSSPPPYTMTVGQSETLTATGYD